MPITITINRDARLVHATATGVISNADMMTYQEDVWMTGDVVGYDGIFDGSLADFSRVNFTGVLAFSQNSAKVDLGTPRSKMAIVVGSQHLEQLAEFYKTAKESLPGDSRTTRIFYRLEDAFTWVSNGAS
ncbi:MAG: hypothetical protein AB9873_20000 [Syntrophobacteraceae bacterium]